VQSWSNIVRTEGGIAALFRGNLAAIYLWMGYSSVQFALYDNARRALSDRFGGGANRDGDSRSEPSSGTRSLHPTATAFVAGAFAGSCATLATYPFDVCRTTFAARGVVTATTDAAAAATTAAAPPPEPPPPAQFHSMAEPHFPVSGKGGRLDPFRASTVSPPPPAVPPSPAAPAGGARPPKTFWEFAVALYRQTGWRGFFAGAEPALLQIIPYMGLNFAIFDTLTRNDRSVYLSGAAGSISGAVSKVIVYPMDTIKRRLQAQAFFVESVSGGAAYSGLKDCALRTWKHEGVTGFYRGVVPSVLKSTIGSGLSFALFRLTKNALE